MDNRKKNDFISAPVRYYPKTSIPMACADDPKGFASVNASFNWPTVFRGKLSPKFGPKVVTERLKRWKWACSTAFSGVGAPESVIPLVLYSMLMMMLNQLESNRLNWRMLFPRPVKN